MTRNLEQKDTNVILGKKISKKKTQHNLTRYVIYVRKWFRFSFAPLIDFGLSIGLNSFQWSCFLFENSFQSH